MVLNECFVCGVSGQVVRLLDAISSKGFAKICVGCSIKESVPILKRPTTHQLKESESNARPMRRVPFDSEVVRREKERLDTETTLREIVDRNYKSTATRDIKPRPDLIEHFHWVIMRARRSKKITQEQMAREISESVAAIKMAEQGILPEDDRKFIKKIESFLGIMLVKEDVPQLEEDRRSASRMVDFDPVSLKSVTIDDLKRMKEARRMGKSESDEEEIID